MKIPQSIANTVRQTYSNSTSISRKIKNIDENKNILKSDTDSVSLSKTTKNLQSVLTSMDNDSEARTQKLTELKKSFEDGTYEVDTDKIAEKMLDEFLYEAM